MPKNTRTNQRRKLSAVAQRRLPLGAPAHPREEYRLRDLIERLDLALDTYIDRAVVVAHYDYDEILREAIRVALRTNISADDDWDDLYTRIRQLMTAYIASPEGQGEDPSVLMARLAACIADVVPAPPRPRARNGARPAE
jgi:hypothetical protein